ncbi:MAG: ParB/RepB/Spo0J family partition protein [Candidatus Dormibacteria bacterium]
MDKVEIGRIRVQAQQRSDLGDLDGLKRSIEANGLLQPLVLRPEGSDYVVVCGHRRLRCVTELGWTEVEAVLRNGDAAQVATSQFAENFERENLSAADVAGAVQQMIDLGVDVSGATSLTREQVGAYKSFNGLDVKLQEAVLNRQISQEEAAAAQKGLEKFPEHRERILGQVWQARWIVQTLEREARQAKLVAAATKKAAKLRLTMAVEGEVFASLIDPSAEGHRWGKVAMTTDAHRLLVCHRARIDIAGSLVEGCNDPSTHGDLFEGRVLQSEATSVKASGAQKGAETRARNKEMRAALPDYEESIRTIFGNVSTTETVAFLADHLLRHLQHGDQDAAAALAGCDDWDGLVRKHGIEKAVMAALWAQANEWVVDSKKVTGGYFRLTNDSEDLLAFWSVLGAHGHTEDPRLEGAVRKAYGSSLEPVRRRALEGIDDEVDDIEDVA